MLAERLRRAVQVLCGDISERHDRAVVELPTEHEAWFELTVCILSSQVPYGLAVAAASALRQRGLIAEWAYAPSASAREGEIAAVLRTPCSVDGQQRRYRFPNLRARQLANTHDRVRTAGCLLSHVIRLSPDPRVTRQRIIGLAEGVGPKQASMFLRNVGQSVDLAILDRHLLRYMVVIGLADSLPRGMRLATYENLEDALRRHADDLGYSLGVVDAAAWIVMRVAARERLI